MVNATSAEGGRLRTGEKQTLVQNPPAVYHQAKPNILEYLFALTIYYICNNLL